MRFVCSNQYEKTAKGLHNYAFLTPVCHRKEVKRYLSLFEQHSDLCIRYGVYQTISDTVQEYSDERAADSPSTIHYHLTKYSFREFHQVVLLCNSNSSGHVNNSVNVIS